MANIVYPKDFKEMPWKNGQGTTKEIFRIPHESQPDQSYFRISTALVAQSGRFSEYPNMNRFLMLLEGKGFNLHFEDQTKVTLSAGYDSFEFEGEESINCQLIEGPCLDFNVMTMRGWGESTVTLSSLKMNQVKKYAPKTQTYLYLCQTSPKLIILDPGEAYELKAGENMTVVEVELKKHRH